MGLLAVHCADREAGLGLEVTLELLPSGLLRGRARPTNEGEDGYAVEDLVLALPVPDHAEDILGVGFEAGETWGVHTAWSGNHTHYAERTSTGARVVGGGELLLTGEVVLASGESYTTPWVYGSWGDGLDAVAHRFHRYLRSRSGHVGPDRPVTLNVWEAVYFDHDTTGSSSSPGSPPTSASSATSSTTAGSAPGGTTPPGSGTGSSRPMRGPRDCTPSSTPSPAWGCSSGCGSSRRWSTSTPTSPGPTRSG